MKYQNIKTGTVIETDSEMGGNWKPIRTAQKEEQKEAQPKKKGAAKK